ncbi:MAG: HpcH/HpaI aldolase/citrate lyase family protein, partial [Gammaproteobacteria bacterium]|nr:HpcH/HpaI aldolase/citrate lyase family protein [Gammaproteobacteria bacterium]
ARRDGFTGKIAIHPAQVPVINEAFSPSTEELAHAHAVIDAFAATPDAGTLSLDGKMIDRPHLKQAERIVALAEMLDR